MFQSEFSLLQSEVRPESLFKDGEQVRLRSGGPVMTVTGHEQFEGEPVCMWFARDRFHVATFPDAALERVAG